VKGEVVGYIHGDNVKYTNTHDLDAVAYNNPTNFKTETSVQWRVTKFDVQVGFKVTYVHIHVHIHIHYTLRPERLKIIFTLPPTKATSRISCYLFLTCVCLH
jgi:hypothetical protein